VDLFASYTSIDTSLADALGGDAARVTLPSANVQPIAPRPKREDSLPLPTDEGWTENFVRTLQAQHARIREFLQLQSDRWRQVAADLARQIEKLQDEVDALTAANEVLHAQSACAADRGPAEDDGETSRRYMLALDDIRELKARNTELQQQLRTANSAASRPGPLSSPVGVAEDWETQKRRLLAEMESDEGQDAESTDRRLKIEEIIARTDKIIAEKDREIEELQHLLSSQSNSLGSLAVGAAALEQVFDQDEIIRDERQRLQQAQNELREKLRMSEIEHAMERARLARREAEIEERLRNGEPKRSADADTEALAPTGRPIRGRWRTQMGLTDDAPPSSDGRR